MHNELIREQTPMMDPVSFTDAFDPFYNECRHTDSLPSWLQLQQQVREQLNRLMARMDADGNGTGADLTASDLQHLNQTIAAYNNSVPNVHLQKPLIGLSDLEEALDSWQ